MTASHSYAGADALDRPTPAGRPAGLVQSSAPGLQGLRIMVVEDEAVVSMMIEQMLEDFGCCVVDMASRLRQAMQAAQTTDCDLALLDMNLAGEPVDAVVEILQARGIRFVFATGYGRHDLRPCWSDRPVLAKPFRADQLKTTIINALMN